MKVRVRVFFKKIEPVKHINNLFYNHHGVISILEDEEEIEKACKYFGALPINLNFHFGQRLIASTSSLPNLPLVKVENLRSLLYGLNSADTKQVFVNLNIEAKVELIPEKLDGILRDCDDNEIKNGCFVSIQGAEPIKVHKFDNEFYFVPNKDIVKVKEYFKDDIKIAYYE